MRTTALSPFGIAINDVDIASVPHGRADRLRELIARHRVAVFRDQTGGDAALVHFLESLGEPTFTDGETAVDGAPSLNIVANIGRATPPRSVFHSDTSYVAQPPSFTALRAVLLPETGGATLFSDQVGALDRLPRRFRSQLRHCSVLHRVTGLDGRDEETTHPLFRRHPLTDEVALSLSTQERCIDVSGFDAATSARVVAALYQHSIRGSGLYRHAWQAGDVVVWDNRVTMHRADHEGGWSATASCVAAWWPASHRLRRRAALKARHDHGIPGIDSETGKINRGNSNSGRRSRIDGTAPQSRVGMTQRHQRNGACCCHDKSFTCRVAVTGQSPNARLCSGYLGSEQVQHAGPDQQSFD